MAQRRGAHRAALLLLALAAAAHGAAQVGRGLGAGPGAHARYACARRPAAARRGTLARALPLSPRPAAPAGPSELEAAARRERMARVLRSAARARLRRPRAWARGVGALSLIVVPRIVRAMGGGGSVPAGANLDPSTLPLRILLWAVLFVGAAGFAAAETAITTLWPWKIKKIIAEEGPTSPFAPLTADISRVLTTLLIGVTICTVYSTALATLIATTLFGASSLNLATFALTLITLIFAEILPKTLAVSQAEAVARLSMPIVNAFSGLLTPVSLVVRAITRALTTLLNVEDGEDGEGGAVSQPELKLMLMGAMKSGSIANYEVEMIEGVLDMETTQVKEVMKPRVDVVGIDASATVADLFALIQSTKFSRIPVYESTIDNIIGVARAQSLLAYAQQAAKGEEGSRLQTLKVSDVMEDTDYIPQTMAVMNALKEMRKRRLHMLIVVDEYGGTAGIVTLEDVLEELVGDIYDEADAGGLQEVGRQIVHAEDGSWAIDGMADLEETCESLGMELCEEELREFGTLSGFLCHQAGEIPEAGDVVLVSTYKFTVLDCDERKITLVRAEGTGDTEGGERAGDEP